MQKLLVSSVFIILLSLNSSAFAIQPNYDELEENTITETTKPSVIIPQGSYFRGFLGQTVSSEFNNTDDIVKILITSDFTIEDRIILPKNSVFLGQIKGLQKAQQGLDGTFAIDIIALFYPDGRQFPVKGYVIAKGNSKIFGGGFSKRTGYKTTLHRSECFGRKGVLQLQQNGPRSIGKETKINMGDLVTILVENEIRID